MICTDCGSVICDCTSPWPGRLCPACGESRARGQRRPLDTPPAEARTLGQRLRYWRLRAGMTQQQVARRVGTYQAHISSLEADRYRPQPVTLRALAMALGVERQAIDPR